MNTLEYEPTRICWFRREYKKWLAYYEREGMRRCRTLAVQATQKAYEREFFTNVRSQDLPWE